MLRHIVAAIDGSETATKAVALAGEMAAKFAAKLTLVHVIEDFAVPEELKRFAEAEHLPEEPYRLHLQLVATGIMDEAVRIAVDKGVAAPEQAILVGKPAATLVDFAAANAVDAIVIGSRGLGRLEGLVLGSVSQKVAQLTDCTCVTVK